MSIDLQLVATLADLLAPRRHVLVGTNAAPHYAAALLARQRGDGCPRVTVIGGGARDSFLTDDLTEIFHCAAQGRFDGFVVGGGQIDGRANINLVGVGTHPRMEVRFPGSHGTPLLYLMIPNIVIFRSGHSRKALVEQVDFISAPGVSGPEVHRPGGPTQLLTDRALFDFDKARARFTLRSVHAGQVLDDVVAETGFGFDRPEIVPCTPSPNPQTLRAILDEVCPMLHDIYPQFARSLREAAARQLGRACA
ncbi:MAG TPA: CoA-transferase [Ramlibacter sp.]|nr:CoA-transferase [Ramlibacter sp.]